MCYALRSEGWVRTGEDAHPVCDLFVLAGVNWLLADWLNHDKFFDLLLARTGGNEDNEAHCCQKFDAL
jgi:hypothetical protein